MLDLEVGEMVLFSLKLWGNKIENKFYKFKYFLNCNDILFLVLI